VTFEERFSNLFQRRQRTDAAARAAAAGTGMPPIGGNRLTNFLAFPPGTDPSVNRITNPIQQGISRLPYTVKTVINNNSPIPTVSAKPGAGSVGPGARVRMAAPPSRAVARGTTVAGLSRMNRVRLAWRQAATRIRGSLGG